jgi:hypothetical protein
MEGQQVSNFTKSVLPFLNHVYSRAFVFFIYKIQYNDKVQAIFLILANSVVFFHLHVIK